MKYSRLVYNFFTIEEIADAIIEILNCNYYAVGKENLNRESLIRELSNMKRPQELCVIENFKKPEQKRFEIKFIQDIVHDKIEVYYFFMINFQEYKALQMKKCIGGKEEIYEHWVYVNGKGIENFKGIKIKDNFIYANYIPITI